jgi:hypothetical protein
MQTTWTQENTEVQDESQGCPKWKEFICEHLDQGATVQRTSIQIRDVMFLFQHMA